MSRSIRYSGKSVEGTCYDMCPVSEIALREKEKLVHVLEVISTGRKLIKCYCRSAADLNMAVAKNLRPFSVLLKTIHYLFMEVSNRTDVKTSVIYDFLNDRLRSIRQDITIQRLPPEQCIVLLEPMIRFHVYFGYRLCEQPRHDYDPVLNQKYLLECMKWFLSCCDKIDLSAKGNKENLDVDTEAGLAVDRTLVECLYIMCNLDNIHPLYRYLQLPKSLKRLSSLRLTYEIAVANNKGNYVRVLKLAHRLCPLTFAALSLYKPVLQRRALQVMCHAYNCKQLTVPVSSVRLWLACTSDEEVRDVCNHYGLYATDVIQFNKGSFKADIQAPSIKRNYSVKISQLKLEDVLYYTL